MHMVTLALWIALAVPQDGIPALLDRLKTEDPQARAEALRGLVDAGAAAVGPALQALAREDTGLAARVDAEAAKLASRSWKERDEAVRALARLGRRALERLHALAEKAAGEASLRLRAAIAAIREHERSEQEMELLRDAAICEFLGAAGDARATEPLLKVLDGGSEGPAELVAELRIQAAEALGRLRAKLTPEQADRATDAALGMLEQSRGRRSQATLIRALGALRSPGAVRPLVRLIDDAAVKDVHIKATAMQALVRLDSPWGVRSVILALGSGDAFLREGAVRALKPAAGTDWGVDPVAGPAPAETIRKARAWWEKKYRQGWDDEEK